MAKLWLLVGLPAAGKTTAAKRLAHEHAGLRLTPDEWMIPLFGEPEANGRRNVLEGRLITVALDLLRLDTNVILDFGCWSRDERAALHWLVRRSGAEWTLVYLPIHRSVQLHRVAGRRHQTPAESFTISAVELDAARATFDVPTSTEFTGSYPERPPAGWTDWAAWARNRWPTLTAD